MTIDEAKHVLDQIKAVAPNTKIRVSVSCGDLGDNVQFISARPVFESNAWNEEEISFKEFLCPTF